MGSISAVALHPENAGLHLRLLGRFELSSDSCLLRVRPSGERLLAYLAVRSDPVTRQEAAATLWPDCPDVRAAANLRSVLWRLPGNEGGMVRSHARGIALMPGVSIDVDEISGQLSENSAISEHLSISMLRQDVLPDWPELWMVATREWFRQIRLRALEKLCDQHRAAGHLDSAMAAGLAAVACDPLRESAHRRLALMHISEGNLAEALRQYHVYQQLAQSELGLPPSPQFRTLMSPLLGRPTDR
jgi:DNA-binding SARP family transcriptional activator